MKDYIRKAGFIVCLFSFLPLSGQSLNGQSFQFNEREQELYRRTLDLELGVVLKELSKPSRAEEYYILSLAQTIDLLISEDKELFKTYERQFEKRRSLPDKTPTDQFLQAEMRLQWAFASLKFGHELDAAFNIRQAFQIAEECHRKNPDFIPIRKTTGLLNVMIGAIPEKFNWLLSLMGLSGSTEAGINDLHAVISSGESLSPEARLLLGLCEGFIFQTPEKGLSHILELKQESNYRLVDFFAASLAIKNSQSELALGFLKTFEQDIDVLPYSQYLLAEVYLHKAKYDEAIKRYAAFLSHYRGENYVKDAHFKMGLCYLLSGSAARANEHFNTARNSGKEMVEADVSAAHTLDERTLPPIELSKVRYATDGGYYEEAEAILNRITPSHLKEKKDQVEYYYRRGRLSHKRGNPDASIIFYKQVIDMSSGENSWYFAPNAALQLGYIYYSMGRESDAREYFEKALTYKKHEYKNSIDSKAKSALDQIDAK